MKFTPLILSLTIASANAKTRRHLNTIKGDESDASMSYMLSPARGSSKSKSATGAPTGSPTSAPTPIEPGECNSVINTGGIFTLQKDLQCDCRVDPALTVDGRGTVLDLNGHTVQCTIANISFGAVVEVIGTNNAVKGPGTLRGPNGDIVGPNDYGIKLSSGAFHTVDGVNISSNIQFGINIDSDSNDNTIINNFITGSTIDGVLATGTDRNIIKGNMIVNSKIYGIRLVTDTDDSTDTSDDNQVLDNTIISSSINSEGISVRGGKRNVIQGNTINQSAQFGIEIDFGSEDVIIKDNSITNSFTGIQLNSLNTVVIGNTLAGNTNINFRDIGTDTGTVLAGNIFDVM